MGGADKLDNHFPADNHRKNYPNTTSIVTQTHLKVPESNHFPADNHRKNYPNTTSIVTQTQNFKSPEPKHTSPSNDISTCEKNNSNKGMNESLTCIEVVKP